MPAILRTIIELNAAYLEQQLMVHALTEWDSDKILLSICGCESKFGANTDRRFEPAYGLGGKFANPALLKKYGVDVPYSYSSFQMMYPVARELGFDGEPMDLELPGGDWICCPLVCLFIQKRLLERYAGKREIRLEDIPDSYNSGSPDGYRPDKYIAEFMGYYNTPIEELWKRLTY